MSTQLIWTISTETIEKVVCYFSSWHKLRTFGACQLCYKSCFLSDNVRGKSGEASGLCSVVKGNVTVDEMKASEQEVLIRRVLTVIPPPHRTWAESGKGLSDHPEKSSVWC